jgi:hypothetical protein
VQETKIHTHGHANSRAKQPGNNINLYLQLLKEELETLWAEEGVNTWDANAQNYFPLKAVLITTVHDYLGYGYVLG